MNLCEAYVLCLIDEIDRVLDESLADLSPLTEVLAQELLPGDTLVAIDPLLPGW